MNDKSWGMLQWAAGASLGNRVAYVSLHPSHGRRPDDPAAVIFRAAVAHGRMISDAVSRRSALKVRLESRLLARRYRDCRPMRAHYLGVARGIRLTG